ncbi:MAG: hypothetical protein AAGA55_05855 [Planctomycetota bacterium]
MMNRTRTTHPGGALPRWCRGVSRGAFTVVELLVVIVVIIIVLTIATPAFRSLIYSSERSLAFNSVEAAVASARDVALRSAGGDDGAVVFLYDQGGPMRIVPAVRVGSIRQQRRQGELSAAGQVEVDLFAPVADAALIEMPRNWHVRGYAPAGSMVDLQGNGTEYAAWYNSEPWGGVQTGDDIKDERNWVFPESGFYPVDLQVSPRNGSGAGVRPNLAAPTSRQSFMIRFDARTGAVSTERGLSLLIDPRPSSRDRVGGGNPDTDQLRLRPDRSEDLIRWARGLIDAAPFNPNTGRPLSPPYSTQSYDSALAFIGIQSNDTVLVKPVSRFAVYDERRMAQDIGARSLNAGTGTIYRAVVPDGSGDNAIRYDESLFRDGLSSEGIRDRVNAWIEGDTNDDGEIDDEDEPQARLYLVRPLTGELVEVLR